MERWGRCVQCGKSFLSGKRGGVSEFCIDCRLVAYRVRHYKYKKQLPFHGNTKLDAPYSDKLRELVRERDNICQICGSTSNLNVHHKDNMGSSKTSTPNQTMDNLILLCASCHMRLHYNGLEKHRHILERRIAGETLQSIANSYGLSRQRIHAILKENKK